MTSNHETVTLELDGAWMTDGRYALVTYLNPSTLRQCYHAHVVDRVMALIAEKLADAYVQQHGAEALAKLSPEAIGGVLSLRTAEAVVDSLDGVRQAIKDRPRPVTHVHNTVHSSIF